MSSWTISTIFCQAYFLKRIFWLGPLIVNKQRKKPGFSGELFSMRYRITLVGRVAVRWVRNGHHHHFRNVMTATDMRYFLSFHIFRSIWTLALIEAFACKREKMVNISVWVISFPRPFLEFLGYCDKKEFLEFISLRLIFYGGYFKHLSCTLSIRRSI